MATYMPPVDALLKLGDPREESGPRDYLALGLGAEHVPELIRLLQDEAPHQADSESPEVWGPLHAWCALGQLRAEAAIEPLIGLLRRFDNLDDEWVNSELPGVFGQIGSAAIVPLERTAAEAQNSTFARSAAMEGLKAIGQQHPEAREAAVAALTRLLEGFAEPGRDPNLNGFLVYYLVELQAREAAPLIERAFAAGAVAEDIQGGWEDVQVELGLKAPRLTERAPKISSNLEKLQLLQQAWQPPSDLAADEPAGPKRKHHRRKK